MSTISHLASYLAGSASSHPARPAVVEPDGRSVGYSELHAMARRIAGHLERSGIGSGDRVGVMMPKSIETVASIFGVLTAGASYVPVDPSAPHARCRSVLEDCEVSALFLDASTRGILDGWDGPTDHVVTLGDEAHDGSGLSWASVAGTEPTSSEPAHSTEDQAYILYTSGSTGTPKGVSITHRNASSFVEWAADTFEPGPEDRFTSHAPFHFDLSIFDLFVAIKVGASVHLIPDELLRSPRHLARFVAEREITVWYSTPSALTLLGQHGRWEEVEYVGPRLVLFAGEVFPVKHLRRMTRIWADADWWNLYGPTETNVCTFARVPLPVPDGRVEPYPIGRACAHCRIRVVDTHGGTVEDDREGALHVSGDPVFAGYWGRPEENARVFTEHAGDRWYDTGDVVRRDRSGDLVFVGRRDRMVKRRGYRIELGEVESALHRHPGLDEVAVVALSDEAGVRIVACYSSESVRSVIELKEFSSRHLPAYMVPDAFEHVDRLPTTSTGKTDYRQLAQSARAPTIAP